MKNFIAALICALGFTCGGEPHYYAQVDPGIVVDSSSGEVNVEHLRVCLMSVREAYFVFQGVDVTEFNDAMNLDPLTIFVNEDTYMEDNNLSPDEIRIEPFNCALDTPFVHQLLHATEWRLWFDADSAHMNSQLWGVAGMQQYIDNQVHLLARECQ